MTIARRIVLTGVPRSGTTLCCRLLGQAVQTVALFEPMQVYRLESQDRSRALDQVEAFFEDSRASLLSGGRALSQQIDGVVPDNPIASERGEDGRRLREATLGEVAVDKPLGPGFTLVIKHNAAFTAMLPELAQRFETWAIVRNPLAVLASWHSVSLPVSRGRLPAGERLDSALAARLERLEDVVSRQLIILDWFFGRFARLLDPSRVIAYEEVVATAGQALTSACGIPVPSVALHERNASLMYDHELAIRLAARLLENPGAWRAFYSEADVTSLAERMSGEA